MRETSPAFFSAQDLFVAVEWWEFLFGGFFFSPFSQSSAFWCCQQNNSSQFLHTEIVHVASRPRPVSVIPSINYEKDLGFVLFVFSSQST